MNLPLKAYWNLLSEHIRPQQRRFLLMAALLLGSIGLQVGSPLIMRTFIDAALAGALIRNLFIAALLFLGITLLQQVVAVSVVYLSETVAWSATNTLRAELARHCLRLDMGFHNLHTPGELIERIDGDVTQLALFFSQFVVTLLGNLLLLIGIVAVLLLQDWRVGLAFGVYAFLSMWILSRVRRIAIAQEKAHRQAEADLFGFIEEQLAATEDTRSSGATDFSLRELYRLQGSILRRDSRARRRGWIIDAAMGGLLAVGNLLAIGSGYWLYNTGTVSIGTVYLFVHYATLLEIPIWTLVRQVQSFQTIGACVERLGELRSLQPTVLEGAQEHLPAGAVSLSFQEITFRYSDGEPVLQDLSFHLPAGQILGLLGRTGSGKSTLARLVFRLYDPTQGSILLGENDLRSAKLDALRGRVAMVTQEVQLFQGSLRDNLTFFDRQFPDERIEAAIRELGLDDWYASLPAGLDTRLESGGRGLSAGEAQLLALTRVFLRDPGLIILDEASARLDPATEQRIERALDRLLHGRTALIIAHRLGTVQRADSIMIIENGRACEYGLRRELASNPNSRFYELLQTGLEQVLA